MKTHAILMKFTLAILMAVLTSLFCLVIADGILGTDGHYVGNIWYVQKNYTGQIFFWVSMIAITTVFAFFVEWRYTWITILVYMLLYIPTDLYFGESPQHTYLDKTTFAMLTIGPDLGFLRPLLVAIRFWVAQSFIYLAVWPIKASVKWFVKRRKERAS